MDKLPFSDPEGDSLEFVEQATRRKQAVMELAHADAALYLEQIKINGGALVMHTVPVDILKDYQTSALAAGKIFLAEVENYAVAFNDYCLGGHRRRDN